MLVRHAMPEVSRDQPAREWPLSDAGRTSCAVLAERLRAHEPAIVISSLEPKARETGRLVADALDVLWHTAEDLHEHARPDEPWLGSADFDDRVRQFFAQPRERVFGSETAAEATERFGRAVDGLLKLHRGESLAVVAHGTVISLYLQARCQLDGFATWQALGLPSFIALDRANLGIVEVATQV